MSQPVTTPFTLDSDLIFVNATLHGPRGDMEGTFVVDTGASMTTIIPELADALGYSVRAGIRSARVETALGSEVGYVLAVPRFESLGFAVSNLAVHVFDLGHLKLAGLLGMNFLLNFNLQISPDQRHIVAALARGSAQVAGAAQA